eukprot:gene6337-1347_t
MQITLINPVSKQTKCQQAHALLKDAQTWNIDVMDSNRPRRIPLLRTSRRLVPAKTSDDVPFRVGLGLPPPQAMSARPSNLTDDAAKDQAIVGVVIMSFFTALSFVAFVVISLKYRAFKHAITGQDLTSNE